MLYITESFWCTPEPHRGTRRPRSGWLRPRRDAHLARGRVATPTTRCRGNPPGAWSAVLFAILMLLSSCVVRGWDWHPLPHLGRNGTGRLLLRTQHVSRQAGSGMGGGRLPCSSRLLRGSPDEAKSLTDWVLQADGLVFYQCCEPQHPAKNLQHPAYIKHRIRLWYGQYGQAWPVFGAFLLRKKIKTPSLLVLFP